MDSPVIVDTASKFGRNLDPGFGFDDEGFRRSKDIRSHLDDLAARHPEFADHLLGPPWGDFTLPRRRGSGASHQSHPDEDARSQASGSSAASAASGASGVSSHGDPETIFEEPQTKLPQYGLRNTVDIGQHQHNMQNQDKGGRNQRSMSAPPENRPDDNQPQDGQSQNPRFVSRVDITPKFNNQTTEKSSKPESQSPPQPQKQQQSNVRHIPIFVEGRDEPVIPRNKEEPVFTKQQSPPRYTRQQSPPRFTRQPSPPRFHQSFDSPPEFHAPPHFHRPSHFTSERFARPREWKQFTEDVFDGPFEGMRRTHSPFRQQTERQGRAPEAHFPQGHSYHQTSQQPQEKQQEKPAAEPEKPKQQIQPKDPLERVALVQQEVDSLHEQVKLWNGNTRQDKQYIYLDEMLTRELIKLDDIETEGKEAVRQSRKNTIKSIQDAISLLESKAPLPGQTPVKELSSPPEFNQPKNEEQKVENVELMETEKKPEEEAKPIPLPAPSSPVKESAAPQNEVSMNGQQSTSTEGKGAEKADGVSLPDPNVAIPMEGAPVEPSTAMEIQTDQAQKASNEATNEDTTKISKSPKKVKKAKKQTPVSMEPIPLPGPEAHQIN
ncbi:BAG domain-containing protein Samui isoform X2 [Diachasma alloeum]|uniref:BAG domain-containing protein Samui isoform X2 n=1 Tax=Diachasma alloeum TaxID=454923 RepID=UPI0007384470|nr:BAG domain-containing protein Samui isoform X2 [Diachasma alloeum]